MVFSASWDAFATESAKKDQNQASIAVPHNKEMAEIDDIAFIKENLW